MRAWALAIILLALPAQIVAQNLTDWQHDEGLDPRDPREVTTAGRVEVLLGKYRLNAVPNAPKDINHVAHFIHLGEPRYDKYYMYFSYPDPRGPAMFSPHPRSAEDCAKLIDYEIDTVLNGEVRKALGITLRPAEPANQYVIRLVEYGSGRADSQIYIDDRPIDPAWVEYFDEGKRFFSKTLKPGDEISSRTLQPGNRESLDVRTTGRLPVLIGFRTNRGECRFTDANRIRVIVPITVGGPAAIAAPRTVTAPKPVAPTFSAPKRGGPTLTVTSPPPLQPAAPETIIYKPGERPKPPAAPTALPCPKGMACGAAEGGPSTPEGRAYLEKLRAYEAEVREFETKEAAQRLAVADLNKQRQAEYAAQQAATDKQRADALAAREAKVQADKAAYNAQLRAHQEEVARRAVQHEAAMAEWRRKTAACLAGDLSQCANGDPK